MAITGLRRPHRRPARPRSTEDGQLGAATVVIQYTTVRTSRFLEYGQRPPYAVSTGSGTGIVLRDGRSTRVDESEAYATVRKSVEQRMRRLGLSPALAWPLIR